MMYKKSTGIMDLKVIASVSSTECFVLTNSGRRYMAITTEGIMNHLLRFPEEKRIYISYICTKLPNGLLKILKPIRTTVARKHKTRKLHALAEYAEMVREKSNYVETGSRKSRNKSDYRSGGIKKTRIRTYTAIQAAREIVND